MLKQGIITLRPRCALPSPSSRRQAMRPIVNVPEEDQATDISNTHRKLVKIARVVSEISSRTDRQTDRHSSQYFAAAPGGEIINNEHPENIISRYY